MTTQTLKERAESYAAACQGQVPQVSIFDYIAGAKEERILVIEQAVEWLHENMTDTTYLGVDSLRSFEKTKFIEQFKEAMTE